MSMTKDMAGFNHAAKWWKQLKSFIFYFNNDKKKKSVFLREH